MKSVFARMGGLARNHLHGNPGTQEGRKLGGLRSLETHRLKGTRFSTLRTANIPQKTESLAELMGVIAGDGHVGTYQISVTTSSLTDEEHALHVQKMLRKAFRLPVSLIRRKNVFIVLLSSKHACQIVNSLGMPSGNKMYNQIRPPVWVQKSLRYKIAYLRGLIDTDGTVYKDRHTIKGREYSSTCLAFTNASIPLLDFVESVWKEIGYSPNRWGRNIRLRRKREVIDYAQRVGFSNPKHRRKIRV